MVRSIKQKITFDIQQLLKYFIAIIALANNLRYFILQVTPIIPIWHVWRNKR
jgi:hypothetical protein